MWLLGGFYRRHNRKSTGVSNNMNNGSVLSKCPSNLWVSMYNTRTLKQLNGIQPSLVLLFTPVLFLPWHLSMFLMGKAYWAMHLVPNCSSGTAWYLQYYSNWPGHNISLAVKRLCVPMTFLGLIHMLLTAQCDGTLNSHTYSPLGIRWRFANDW